MQFENETIEFPSTGQLTAAIDRHRAMAKLSLERIYKKDKPFDEIAPQKSSSKRRTHHNSKSLSLKRMSRTLVVYLEFCYKRVTVNIYGQNGVIGSTVLELQQNSVIPNV